MKLSYFDGFAFALMTKNGTVAINPQKKDESLLFSIFTEPQRDELLQDKFLSWPGEYEFGGVAAELFLLPGNFLGARMFAEEMSLLFLPVCPQELTEREKELLGNIDVLIVNVAESDAILKKLIEEIDPKVIIPVGPQQEKFLLEMGAANVAATEEFSFEQGNLPIDKTEFIKLISA